MPDRKWRSEWARAFPSRENLEANLHSEIRCVSSELSHATGTANERPL